MPIRRRGTRRARRTSHRQNNNTDFSLLPSYEGRHDESYDAKGVSIFQSTPLMRRETCGFIQITLLLSISIHSPHARGDDVGDHESGYRRYFNPLPSCEGRLEIPLVRGQVQGISIHSPHARGDIGNGRVDIPIRISIHSPHARGDGRPNRTTKRYYPFQSTPLMRGETRVRALRDLLLRHFNPLPSCEGRLTAMKQLDTVRNFNPNP